GVASVIERNSTNLRKNNKTKRGKPNFMKKVYIFMLMLLLVSQTIIGPVATVYASEVNDNSSLSVGNHQTDVQKGGQFVDVSTDEDGGDSSKDEGNDAEDVENIAEEDSS